MAKRRVILWGTAAALGAVAVLASWPAIRHKVRHAIAAHRSVAFSGSPTTAVVPVRREMPGADGTAGDLRFAGDALAQDAAVVLVSPRYDVAVVLAPPTVVGAFGKAPATAGFDRTTVTTLANPMAGPALAADLAGARQALRHYHDGDLAGGDDFARPTSGALRTALDWAAIRLRAREAGVPRLQAFATAHPGWPMAGWIGRRIEEATAGGPRDPALVLAMFAKAEPQTLTGTLGLARARLASGDSAGAAALVQAVWRTQDLTGPEEATVLRDFGALLHRDDHKARAERFLYKENVSDALRLAAMAGPDVVLLARACAAVIASAPSDAAMAAVPKALQNDPVLVFSRIQKARRAGRIPEAAALLASAPRDPASIVDGDAWWVERRLVARKLLDDHNPKLAYATVVAAAPDSVALKIESAFHAGWIALRFLDDPALAAPHFAAVSQMAETPISVSRGAYWQGRAAEAEGHQAAATAFFQAAAALPTTFYGQLAATRLGEGPRSLRRPMSPAEGDGRAEAVRAVELLFGLGERDLALSLAVATAKTEPDEAQVAALADVVAATRDARATLVVGKAGAQRGMPIDETAFPTFGIPGYQPVGRSADRAVVLAIARQESEFDPRSVSAAGAMGLMQMMAPTARKTAQEAGLAFNPARFLNDAAFNAQLGAAHLGKLLAELDGSYILTFAAYNAGGGKVQDWIAAYGDPRKPGVDPVDWIERIPFTETRNYVQRVFENLQIYRTQFGMPTAVLTTAQAADGGKGT